MASSDLVLPSGRTVLTGSSRERIERLVFLAPAGIYLVLLTVFPFIYSLYLSLHQTKLTRLNRKIFIGFDNYTKLFSDDLFLHAILNTAILTVASIAIEVVLGFAAAKVFYSLRSHRVGSALRSISIVPMMVTPICIGLIFAYIFNPNLGIANYILTSLGLAPLGWFGDPKTALATVILVNAWQWTPFMMLLSLAGLMSIPHDHYEAAQVEGAKWHHVTRWIEIPAIRGILLIGIILRVIDNLRLFDIVYVTTRGGPGAATELVTFFAYKQDFQYFQAGYGSAAAVVILIISIVVTTIAVSYLRRVERD